MFVFQCKHTACQCISRIIGQHRACSLKNGVAMVILLIHIVNSNATMFFFIVNYGLVHMVAVHTLASILWQQGRMNINDALRESPDKCLWNLP